LQHRFLLEDIPYGMVPLESLGVVVGIPTPTTSAIIELANILAGRDFRVEARDLNNLGMSHMSAEELVDAVS